MADVERPEGLEIATLTHYDIPAMAALHLVAYDRPTVAENLWEVTDEMRMAFDGAVGAKFMARLRELLENPLLLLVG